MAVVSEESPQLEDFLITLLFISSVATGGVFCTSEGEA